ncbi:UNVERIFIED_CONTAM: hypothetical protein H355_009106, partial [Colinus virginianus]
MGSSGGGSTSIGSTGSSFGFLSYIPLTISVYVLLREGYFLFREGGIAAEELLVVPAASSAARLLMPLHGLELCPMTSQPVGMYRRTSNTVGLSYPAAVIGVLKDSYFLQRLDFLRHLLDAEDELSDIQSDSVPSEVRDWLASTVTRQMGMMLKRTEEKPRFRSTVHAVQAGIFVE